MTENEYFKICNKYQFYDYTIDYINKTKEEVEAIIKERAKEQFRKIMNKN